MDNTISPISSSLGVQQTSGRKVSYYAEITALASQINDLVLQLNLLTKKGNARNEGRHTTFNQQLAEGYTKKGFLASVVGTGSVVASFYSKHLGDTLQAVGQFPMGTLDGDNAHLNNKIMEINTLMQGPGSQTDKSLLDLMQSVLQKVQEAFDRAAR